jgi:lysophospholipid acyltransferase (LPLAT)-like uncharacterized protein
VKIPVSVAVGCGQVLGGSMARTWRFRVRPSNQGGLPDSARTNGPDDRQSSFSEVPDGSLANAVYALWHEHLLPLAALHAHQGAAVLVSQHRDGEILARIMTRWGYLPARGSSTRGGEEGLRLMVRAGLAGRPIAFTPDGPRGPARRCKPGVVRAAAETGLPIIPVGVAATHARRLGSWDRFLLPMPWSTIFLSYGPPLVVRGMSEDDLSVWTARVEDRLNREVMRCEAQVGRAV